ncbi:DoxX family protein [Yunchengibacter salinarum]|uniref:DoxX family protein n=1 Tax=Yunchengibacter salinarum TaxID=3133399 RepID=UPI0035B57A82
MTALFDLIKTILNRLEGWASYNLMTLGARFAVSFPFWSSGRSKEGGEFLSMSKYAIMPFENDYNVPFFAPETAAKLALYGETFLPLMLVLGLGARVASAGLLVMVGVITISYSGHSFIESMSWLVALIAILLAGPGQWSVDHLIRKQVYKGA